MSETKHTPGPWSYSRQSPRVISLKRQHWEVGSLEDMKGVAIAFRSEANARLIAYAPELLEACKAAWANLQGIAEGTDLPSIVIRDKLLVAIAKATATK